MSTEGEAEEDALEVEKPHRCVEMVDLGKDRKERPACSHCGVAQRWPRNLSHVNVAALPSDRQHSLPPSTKKTLVAHVTAKPHTSEPTVFPPLFGKLELTTTRSSWPRWPRMLVKEFEYDTRTGNVFYDVSAQEEPHNDYMQLITLNSWISDLLGGVMQVAFSVVDLQANLMLIASFLSNPSTMPSITMNEMLAFTVLWVVSVLISLCFAIRVAWRKYRAYAHHHTGDLITDLHFIENLRTFIGLVVFAFFNLPCSVTDIVLALHPWKNIQAFAAIKCDGVRAYTVGYFNENECRVRERFGQEYLLPSQLLTKKLTLCFKLYWCSKALSLVLLVSVISSLGSIVLAWIHFIGLVTDRIPAKHVGRLDQQSALHRSWRRFRTGPAVLRCPVASSEVLRD
jgi:hypothetical protein